MILTDALWDLMEPHCLGRSSDLAEPVAIRACFLEHVE